MAEKEKKKKDEKEGKGGGDKGGGGNVFDQGNELLLEQANRARSDLGAIDYINPGSSMLSRAQRDLEDEKKKRDSEDEAAEAALRHQAVLARDKVCVLMQQMMGDPRQMEAMASITDRRAQAVQLIEALAPMLTDTELDALAGYDHEDITYRIIISAEAFEEVGNLSAQALKFGAFATVLWELAYEQLQMVSMDKRKEEQADGLVNTEPTRLVMMNLINLIRMSRSSSRL